MATTAAHFSPTLWPGTVQGNTPCDFHHSHSANCNENVTGFENLVCFKGPRSVSATIVLTRNCGGSASSMVAQLSKASLNTSCVSYNCFHLPNWVPSRGNHMLSVRQSAANDCSSSRWAKGPGARCLHSRSDSGRLQSRRLDPWVPKNSPPGTKGLPARQFPQPRLRACSFNAASLREQRTFCICLGRVRREDNDPRPLVQTATAVSAVGAGPCLRVRHQKLYLVVFFLAECLSVI